MIASHSSNSDENTNPGDQASCQVLKCFVDHTPAAVCFASAS